MKNIVIRMVNRDEYHLHDTEITILRIRNFDDMNFIEIDNTIAKEIIYVKYYYNFSNEPTLNSKVKVLSSVSINSNNIASINYLDEE